MKKNEQFDIAPDQAALVYAAPTHKACAVLASRGLHGACTLKSLLYKPVFIPPLQEALLAVSVGKPDMWPKAEPRLPEPGEKRFAAAVAAFKKYGERGFFEELDLNSLDFIDKTQGRLGWVPKNGARYRVVVLDEAGMAQRGEVDDLRARCDLLVLTGDAAGQLQPVITDEDREHAQQHDLQSALAPASLVGLEAEQLRLTQNMRSQNSLSRIGEIIFAEADPPFWKVLEQIKASCGDTVVFTKNLPLDAVLGGAPVICWRNIPRMWVNLQLRQAIGWTDNNIHIGEYFFVSSVDQRLQGVAPRSLVKNSRWIVSAVHGSNSFDVTNASDPSEVVRNVTLRLAEYAGKDTMKWEHLHGFKYPEFGSKFAMITGVLGTGATAYKVQGDSTDTVVVALDDFGELARCGFVDDDGVSTWRRQLNVAISRARKQAILVTGRDLTFDRTKKIA